jgi:hypothetical protein
MSCNELRARCDDCDRVSALFLMRARHAGNMETLSHLSHTRAQWPELRAALDALKAEG